MSMFTSIHNVQYYSSVLVDLISLIVLLYMCPFRQQNYIIAWPVPYCHLSFGHFNVKRHHRSK